MWIPFPTVTFMTASAWYFSHQNQLYKLNDETAKLKIHSNLDTLEAIIGKNAVNEEPAWMIFFFNIDCSEHFTINNYYRSFATWKWQCMHEQIQKKSLVPGIPSNGINNACHWFEDSAFF